MIPAWLRVRVHALVMKSSAVIAFRAQALVNLTVWQNNFFDLFPFYLNRLVTGINAFEHAFTFYGMVEVTLVLTSRYLYPDRLKSDNHSE